MNSDLLDESSTPFTVKQTRFPISKCKLLVTAGTTCGEVYRCMYVVRVVCQGTMSVVGAEMHTQEVNLSGSLYDS